MKFTSTVVLVDQAGLGAILLLVVVALVLLARILRQVGTLHDAVEALDDPIPEAKPLTTTMVLSPAPSKPFPIKVVVQGDDSATKILDLPPQRVDPPPVPASTPRRGIESSPATKPLRVDVLLARLNAERGRAV